MPKLQPHAVAIFFALLTSFTAAAHATTATTTALTISSGGAATTAVSAGSKVTLSATVTANGTALTTGLVNFCDAAATFCEDIHIVGSAQLTSAGVATFNFRPGSGTHTYKAVFAGTTTYAKSSSAAFSLAVGSSIPTTTKLAVTGSSGSYVLTATVTGNGTQAASPTGSVSFLDTSNGNQILGTSTILPGIGLTTSTSQSIGTRDPKTFLPTSQVVATGDFNGDGYPDLAVYAATPTTTITILLGQGDGTFTTGSTFAVPTTSAGTFVVGDFNADGKLDLVAAYSTYTIFLGNGEGLFTAQSTITLPTTAPSTYDSTSAYITSGAVADFNNDGKPDLLLAGYDAFILLGAGDGTFSTPVSYVTAGSVFRYSQFVNYTFFSVALGDFNGDGNLDVCLSGYMNTYPALIYGKGDGTFVKDYRDSQSTGLPSGTRYVAADADNDGITDIVSEATNQLVVSFGDPSTPFARQLVVAQAPAGTVSYPDYNYPVDTPPPTLAVADFNGDGVADILWALTPSTFVIVPGPLPQGKALTSAATPGLGSLHNLLVADFNGDGYPDIAASDSASNLAVYLTQGTKTATGLLSNFSLSSAGVHQIAASYSGDTRFSASQSDPISITQSSSDELLLSVAPSGGGIYGQQVVITAQLSPYSAGNQSTNGEVINFLANGVSVGTGTLSSGVATLNMTSLPSGANVLKASFAGDSNLSAVTSNSVQYLVKAVPVIIWNLAKTTSVYSGVSAGPALLNATSATPGTLQYSVSSNGSYPVPLYQGTPLAVGTYTLTATLYPQDTTNFAIGSLSISYTVTPAPLTVVPLALSRMYGQADPGLNSAVTGAFTPDVFIVTGSTTATSSSPVGTYPVTYTVTGPNLANYTVIPKQGSLTITQAITSMSGSSGSITYGSPLSAARLANASVPGTFTYSAAPGTIYNVGTYTLQVSFVPTDAVDYTVPNPVTGTLVVTPAILTATAANTARVYGAPNPTFTGTITGAVNNDTLTESFSTVATPASIVGSYPIVPAVTGSALANYTVKTTNGALTIAQAGTATTFALSNNNTTLTANVVSLTSQVPTGSVGFYINQALVGTGQLSGGVAAYTAASAPPANAVISAQYSGDVNFTQSASQPILLLSMQPASASLTVGGASSVSDVITLSAVSGFTGALQLSCSGLPAGATCSFSPASVNFAAGSNSASSTMTIHTGGTASGAFRPSFPGRLERTTALAAIFCIPGIFLTAFSRRRQKGLRSLPSFLLFVFLGGAAASVTACAGSPAAPATSRTAAGTSAVSVVATGPAGFSQSTAVTLTIQ